MRFHHHSSNENTFREKVIGSKFFDGRYWLYLGRKQFNAEWSFFHRCRSHFALKVEFGHGDGDDGIMFHAAIPYLFSVFLSFDGIFGKLFHGNVESRETGIAFHNGSFWFYPFAKTMSWASRDPWWSKSHSFDPVEFICGRNKYTEEDDRGWQDIEITMPEAKYKGKVRLYTGTWKNRFRTKRISRAEIEMEEGIPFPGKGESEWDCGENCTWGMTCPAKDEVEAISSMIEHVLRSRRNYGSRSSLFNYKPEKRYFKSVGVQKETPDAGYASEASCQAT
jgi:hypothetical protein